MTSEPGRCAFEGCQAGGDILPGTPRVEVLSGDGNGREYRCHYHPGCHAAACATAVDAEVMVFDVPPGLDAVTISEFGELAGWIMSDPAGCQCLNTAGPTGFCDGCELHQPATAVVFS